MQLLTQQFDQDSFEFREAASNPAVNTDAARKCRAAPVTSTLGARRSWLAVSSQDESSSSLKNFIKSDWDSIAGVLAAIAAIVLHLLHRLEGEVLLTISTVLIATLFVRSLRRERRIEQIEVAVQNLRQTADSISSATTRLKADVLNNLSSSKMGKLHIYRSRREVYDAIANILEKGMSMPGEKRLYLAALHGHSGDRLIDESEVKDEFASFNAAMLQCIQKPGSEWRVRHLYNIVTQERLLQKNRVREQLLLIFETIVLRKFQLRWLRSASESGA